MSNKVEISVRRKRPGLRPSEPHRGPVDFRREADYLPRRGGDFKYIWIDYVPGSIGFINPFNGNPGSYSIHRINEAMEATGYYHDGTFEVSGEPDQVAQMFREGVSGGTFPGQTPAADFGSEGWDINDNGPRIVGSNRGGVVLGVPVPSSAFQMDDPPFGTYANLGVVADMSGNSTSASNVAYGVNGHSPLIVVGSSSFNHLGDPFPGGDAVGQAVRWDGLVATKIFGEDGLASAAYDVNNDGIIVGVRAMQPFILHPVDGLISLPTDPEVISPVIVRAINASGQMIGTHTPTAFNDWSKGWFFDGVNIHNIPNPTPPVTFDPGGGEITVEASLEPWDLNDNGEVVGEYVAILDELGNETKHGFIWSKTRGLKDLNDTLQEGTDFVITRGTGINNHRDIAATGYHTGIVEGAGRPFLGKRQ